MSSEPDLDPGSGVFSRAIAAQREADCVARGHERAVRESFARGYDPWAASRSVSLVEGSSPSWRERLLSLRVPRTVLFGERSLPDLDTGRQPRAGVRVRIVRAAGHDLASDNPEGLASAIRAAPG